MTYQPKDLEKRPITVIGCGTLGRRIALMMATQGAEVRLYDLKEQVRNAAIEYIEQELPGVVKKTGGKAGTIKGFGSLPDAVKDCWIVFEAVPEILKLKIDTFAQLDKICPKDCILASNSSSYPSSNIIGDVSADGRKRVVNTHFYMPPQADAVEVGSCGETDKAVIDTLMKTFPKYGVTPFFVHKDSVGFIFNRVWAAIKRECLDVVATGVSNPADVDRIVEVNLGSKFGPFELMDQVGLDVVHDIEVHYDEVNKAYPKEPVELLNAYIAKGRKGKKTGKGFFDYDEKGVKIKKDYKYDDKGMIIE